MAGETTPKVRHMQAQEGLRHMGVRAQIWLGWCYLPVIGMAALVALLWIYPYAEQAQTTGQAVTVQGWLPDFRLTASSSVLLTMALAAVMGSVVQAGVVFGLRAGRRTLEAGYEAWYFLRPLVSALLGPLFGFGVLTGLVVLTNEGAATGEVNLPSMVSLGALAGLFTDRVLQQMQRTLGAANVDRPASEQGTPHVSRPKRESES